MEVTIKYHDSDSLTAEEVVQQAIHTYGPKTIVEVRADSLAPHDQIHFALQQIVTYRQLDAFYNNREIYQAKIAALRKEVLLEFAELLDSVIIENESKLVG